MAGQSDQGDRIVPKIDYKKEWSHLYKASAKEVVLVDVPTMNYLMVDGSGDPNTSAHFKTAVEALFSLSYALKFMVKKGDAGIDYGVMPLEGLWWADDPAVFHSEDKSAWQWTVMILQPPCITEQLVQKARDQVAGKLPPQSLAGMRFESFQEGQSAQTLHVGPFSEERPTIERLHRFIADSGLRLRGKHHEIYLSDTRRAQPEKWRTIIRQPVEADHGR
jgi:hypothetical protein